MREEVRLLQHFLARLGLKHVHASVHVLVADALEHRLLLCPRSNLDLGRRGCCGLPRPPPLGRLDRLLLEDGHVRLLEALEHLGLEGGPEDHQRHLHLGVLLGDAVDDLVQEAVLALDSAISVHRHLIFHKLHVIDDCRHELLRAVCGLQLLLQHPQVSLLLDNHLTNSLEAPQAVDLDGIRQGRALCKRLLEVLVGVLGNLVVRRMNHVDRDNLIARGLHQRKARASSRLGHWLRTRRSPGGWDLN
mmetsp:Transcript_58738/g.157365  ORF Transcript_58738/g.157365 Transcript_58738/m.157365 type:complete len:247 (+) Transcript_58738:300-1040(+)